MTKLTRILKINLILSAVYSFLCVSFHADISLLAVFVSAAWTAATFIFPNKILVPGKTSVPLNAMRRFFQYEPFVFISAFVIQRSGNYGMPFVLDLFCAVLWIIITGVSFYIQYLLGEKRVFIMCPEWKAGYEASSKKRRGSAKFVMIEILEWIDALFQAVFTIILLNIFLFQLYEIPSESMVPTFLVKDRVVVGKTLAGPKFPLSQVGIPYIQSYKRGDIVVFRNPHYSSDRKSEVKTFMSQFLYMCSLTLLKTNTDENGELKADPLVKRVCGVPGEQIYMLDGILYARTKNSKEFKEITLDSKFAAWDLNLLSDETREKIMRIPLSKELVENSYVTEMERRNLDLVSAALECQSLAREFSLYTRKSTSADISGLFSSRDMFVYNMFSNVNNLTISLMTAEGGEKWFERFMNTWHEKNPEFLKDGAVCGGDPYSDACFRLNIMCKLVFGRLVVMNSKLIFNSVDAKDWNKDPERIKQFEIASRLNDYISCMDLRNLCLFPENDADGNPVYIPENCYFMMGDNRYNSLDMRHSYDQKNIPLSSLDPYSVTYYSSLAPQYVHRDRILGKASFRFWPPSRAGIPDKMKK